MNQFHTPYAHTLVKPNATGAGRGSNTIPFKGRKISSNPPNHLMAGRTKLPSVRGRGIVNFPEAASRVNPNPCQPTGFKRILSRL